MTTQTQSTTVQVHRVYIRATPQAVWDAITDPAWNARYGYGGNGTYDLRPGGPFRVVSSREMKQAGEAGGFPVPDVAVDGEVVESDPPHRLVLTWRLLLDPGIAAEGFTKVTYEIEETQGGTKLTVLHDLEGAPMLAALVSGEHEAGGGGGWPWVLSDLKSLLETGSAFSR